MHGRTALLDLLDQWASRAEPIPPGDLVQALSRLDLVRDDLQDAIAFDERIYRRIVLSEAPHYQALALCWKSGQRSPIHDHLGSACVVKVVQGRATETRFSRSPCGLLVPLDSRGWDQGSVTACSGRCIHQMGNIESTGQDLITLHVYSPPPCDWRYYRLDQTTLGDNDRILSKPARTVRADLGHPALPQPTVSRPRRLFSWLR